MKRNQYTTTPNPSWFSFIVFALIYLWVATENISAEQVGIVTVDKLNVRPEPGIRKPPIKTLKRGTEITIEEIQNGWLKVRLGKRYGYIKNHSNYVHILTVPQGEKDSLSGSSSDQKVQEFRREADNLHRKIDEASARVRKFTDRETSVLQSLDELEYAIARASQAVKTYRNELTLLGEEISNNQQIYEELNKRINANQVYASKRLVTLYKLSNMGTMPILASSGSIYELLQRKNSLERILVYDDQVRQRLMEDKQQLKGVLGQLNEQQAQKSELEKSVKAELRQMSRDRSNRSRLLAKIQSEKDLQLAALESMKITAKKLDRAIESLATDPVPKSQKTDVPLGSFSKHKGLLKMPIKGKIVSFFGPQKNVKFNVTVFRSGIDIKAKKGAVIRAVYGGRVLFADWFKGYGNMMIIDHGESYYTVYAHLEEIFKPKGSVVSTGEDIATIGEMATAEGPVLHFEVRHHGKPLDPLKWIAKG
jgi:septal ring factor EnvC (AmiA/AmiB activator)